jgi:hypothetical protein
MPKAMANLPPKPRLPKEPDPKMLRTFGPRPSFEDLTPPDPSAPPIPSPSPSAYRRDNPGNPPPPDYKPPSMLVEHKRLAILFAAVCVAFAWYCWKMPHAPNTLTAAPVPRAKETPAASRGVPAAPAPQAPAQDPASRAAQPKQPIYVEALPET